METPRTNKNAGYYCGHGIKKNSDLVIDPNGPFVLADFARELERENIRMREALGKIERHGPIMGSTGDYRQGQLDILENVSTIAALALANT